MKILKVRDVKTPERGTNLSAGIDFFVPNDLRPIKVMPHTDALIPTGIIAEFASNLMLMAAEKSGVTSSIQAKQNCGMKVKPNSFTEPTVLGAKIVDADYKGEIHIHIINLGTKSIIIEPGKKLAQFILVPVYYDDIIEVSSGQELFGKIKKERGANGFGLGTGE